MQSYNDEAFKQYNEVSLEPCHNCGRTFLPDRLKVHLKSCDKAHSKKGNDAGGMNGAQGNQNFGSPDTKSKGIKG